MRKLAAIMFTDIEGFTKLMQHNEMKAIQLLDRHKQIYLQCTKQFKGQNIKFIGDGTLTIFHSVIDAVNCAITLQQALQKEPAIPVRIGIHQGDVIIENKDVIGDAVNMASRIQTCGIAGCILISEKVFDELQNHDEIKTVPAGSFDLKNVSHPVNLYAIAAEGLTVPGKSFLAKYNSDAQKSSKQDPKTSKKVFNNPRVLQIILLLLVTILGPLWFIKHSDGSQNMQALKTIAVLPFENIDKDEANNFLADGLTEEMISLLSSNIDLKIKKIPHSAIDNSRGKVSRLLNEIKAGSVLEGKVQHDKDSLLVFVNLRNVSTNEIIWSKTYHEKFRNLMTVQEQVALQIADALNTSFSKKDIHNFVLDRTYNSDAYIFYIQGRYAQKKRTPASMEEAIINFNRALAEDSNFALAYSGIGDTYTILIDNGYMTYDSGVNLARNAVNHAFALDSTSAEIRASRAIFLSTLEGKRGEALKELQLSIKLSPNYASAHQWYALELAADSQFDSALLHIDKAIELEPFSQRIWLNKGLILELARRYNDAIDLLNYSMTRSPDNIGFRELKTDCLYWLGKKDSVLYYSKLGTGLVNDYQFWEPVCSNNKVKLQKRLQQITSTQKINNETLATYYVFLGENDKALATINEAFDKKEFSWLKYLNVAPAWEPLRKEPQFRELLVKMGFR